MYLVSHFSVDLLCLYLCLRLRLTVFMVIIFGILPSPHIIFYCSYSAQLFTPTANILVSFIVSKLVHVTGVRLLL